MTPFSKPKFRITEGLIPAAGRGNRLFPLTNINPKVMVKLAGKPILEHTINLMKKEGIKEIIITIGYKGNKIKEYFGDGRKMNVKIRYLKLNNLKAGLGASIYLAKKYLKKPFLTILGDDLSLTPSLKNLFDIYEKNKAYVVEGIAREKNTAVLRQTCSVVLGKRGKIIKIVEKPENPFSSIRGCGIYLFNPVVFKYIEKTPLTARGREITRTIDLMAKKGRAYAAFINGVNININRPSDLIKAKKILNNKKNG